jgi:hypothetical protein
VYWVLCTVYCVLCTVYCVLCTVCCVLCTLYCVLCTLYCVLCTAVYCVVHFPDDISNPPSPRLCYPQLYHGTTNAGPLLGCICSVCPCCKFLSFFCRFQKAFKQQAGASFCCKFVSFSSFLNTQQPVVHYPGLSRCWIDTEHFLVSVSCHIGPALLHLHVANERNCIVMRCRGCG